MAKNIAGGRMERLHSPTLRNWEKPRRPIFGRLKSDTHVDMGWGRIIFGHTFASNRTLFDTMMQEGPGKRDLTFYLRDPHVLLSMAPDRFFLDPSHTYRLWSHDYRPLKRSRKNVFVRRASSREDVNGMNRIFKARGMVTCDAGFILDRHATKLRTYLVAETREPTRIVGTVTGVDHVEAFNDPENGASLWSLAVEPTAHAPGVGEALVRRLVEHFLTRGRDYVDLSVMHDNHEAIRLYEKLGFQRVPVFCVKCKNQTNEPLFLANLPESGLNPYARIIVNEARRRGICVEVTDPQIPLFSLTLGGRSICCHESLTDLTSAIALMRCDDKRLTHRALKRAGLKVPRQFEAGSRKQNEKLLAEFGRLVVKPAKGEQGRGISVDVRDADHLNQAVRSAGKVCPDIIIEEFVAGRDVRVIVIGFKFVAAAVRRPARVVGNGELTVAELIEKYNRRRMAATGGESRVPEDEETRRCIAAAGFGLEKILPEGQTLVLRKTANLHTGGTIHDVTGELHPALVDASERAALALNVPVTGLDLCVPELDAPDYVIIEANERPGLANHEPQPVPERFIDFLFPETAAGREGTV
jgi:GNAT-family acetyltransferase (TIGR03103 family)